MNSSPSAPATSQTSAVTLMISDAPPAGVTVLSFEVTVNGAVLNPGDVQLLTAPRKIEVKELKTNRPSWRRSTLRLERIRTSPSISQPRT